MLFLWLLLLIVTVIFLRYLYLIAQRCRLLIKTKKEIRKHNGNIQYYRFPLISVFRHDGKADISLNVQGKTIDVSIITTPLRRVRYHFDVNNQLLELIIERRFVYIVNPRVSRPACEMDRIDTIRKYKMKMESPDSKTQKYFILNPAPISVSKADKGTITTLTDNDNLISGIKVCGLNWFLKKAFD